MRSYLAKNLELTKKILTECNMKNYLNFKDQNGETLLMLVVRNGDNYFFDYLLDNFEGFELNLKDNVLKIVLFNPIRNLEQCF
jgi:ankyrin repeat protein